jgi:phage terminase large subunit-like protein
LTIDTAVSKKTQADYTALALNMVDSDGAWNIKSWHLRVGPLELLDTLFTLYERYRLEAIGIEKTMYLQTFKPFLDEEMRKRNKFMSIRELKHGQQAKEMRIRGLLPRYESGMIYHLKNECDDLENELLRFPKGKHDDCADALAYQLQIAGAPMGRMFVSKADADFYKDIKKHKKNNGTMLRMT